MKLESRLPSAEQVRELVEDWANLYESHNNLRIDQLLAPSIYTNRRVFDDYSHGLKLYVTRVASNASGEAAEPAVDFTSLDIIDVELNDLEHSGQIGRHIDTDAISGEILDADHSVYYDYHSIPFDQDYYDDTYRKTVTRLMSSDVYKLLFKNEFIVKATNTYLKVFYPFTEAELENGHEYPFANFFTLETHISLAYYFSQYLDDRSKVEPLLEAWDEINVHDALGLKDCKDKLNETQVQIIALQKRLKSDTFFGGALLSVDQNLARSLDPILMELKLKNIEISRYKKSEKTICEAMLAARISADLLNLSVYKGQYFRMADHDLEHSKIEDGDAFHTASPLSNSSGTLMIDSLVDFSYSIQNLLEEDSQPTAIQNNKNIYHLRAVIRGWCESITQGRMTDDIVKEAIKKNKKQ